MNVTLDSPPTIGGNASLPAASLSSVARKELALEFYAQGVISAGKATELAGTSRRVFEGWLMERKIERPMDEADLRADLEWARGGE